MVQADLTLLNLVEIELNWGKLKVCGTAELSKATGPFFAKSICSPRVCASTVVILAIFPTRRQQKGDNWMRAQTMVSIFFKLCAFKLRYVRFFGHNTLHTY